MPRLVRRQTLYQRVSAAINPWDFLLWLSEEIETRELDSATVGTQVGIAANFVFLLARANSGSSSTPDDDYVFGDASGPGWVSYLVQLIVLAGLVLSVVNAFAVFTRRRHYRLFEANIETRPGGTSSAQRVRVQSSPSVNSLSPLRLFGLGEWLGLESAESRAHPDSTRDVWELAMWDPRPACLALFAFFSPLHVLVYLFALPLDSLEARPSVAVFKCLVLQAGLSAALHVLQHNNDQRQRDSALIQKEVMHEYDTKFVQPRLHPVVRDMGTQVKMGEIPDYDSDAVELGTPTTFIRRTFQTHPNANYIKHIDPDYVPGSAASTASATTRAQKAAAAAARSVAPAPRPARYSDSYTQPHSSASSRHSLAARASTPPTALQPAAAVQPATTTGYQQTQQQQQQPAAIPTSRTLNFGGNMGIHTHTDSPLKKAISMNDVGSRGYSTPRNSREMAALEQRRETERMLAQHQPAATPAKERYPKPQHSHRKLQQAQSHVENEAPREDRAASPPVPFNPFAKARPSSQYKGNDRFPKRW